MKVLVSLHISLTQFWGLIEQRLERSRDTVLTITVINTIAACDFNHTIKIISSHAIGYEGVGIIFILIDRSVLKRFLL